MAKFLWKCMGYRKKAQGTRQGEEVVCLVVPNIIIIQCQQSILSTSTTTALLTNSTCFFLSSSSWKKIKIWMHVMLDVCKAVVVVVMMMMLLHSISCESRVELTWMTASRSFCQSVSQLKKELTKMSCARETMIIIMVFQRFHTTRELLS